MIDYTLSEKEAKDLKQMYIDLVAMHNRIQAMQQKNERNQRLVSDLSDEEYDAHYDEVLNLETNGYCLNDLEDGIKTLYQSIEDMYADHKNKIRII